MEGNEITCLKCQKEIDDDQSYKCDSCLGVLHKTCIGLTASEIKCMPLQKRLLLLICNDCRKLLARLPYLMGTIEAMKKDIEELKSIKVGMSDNCQKQYSEILRTDSRSSNIGTNFPTLIVKPKIKQTGDKTEKDLKEKVNPTNLNLSIRNSRSTKDGSIIVKCETKEDIHVLKTETEKYLGNKYIIETPKMKNPRVKIIGYLGNKSAKEIECSIRNQNKWIDEKDNLNVTYIKKFKDGTKSTVYMECSPKLFKQLMEEKKIYLEWERHSVYEDLSVTHCFNCQGFYHKSNKCDRKKVCAKCSGSHDTAQCDMQLLKCNNCHQANVTYKKKFKTDHSALDPVCPSTQYHLGILRSKINYSI